MLTILRSARRAALIPATALLLAACDADPAEPLLTDDIVDIALTTSDLSTLIAALRAADLTTALEADGPFTVFAPVNAAFTSLGADVIAALLVPGNSGLLNKILTFHVVSGTAAMSGDLSDGQTVTTLQGESLTIGVSAGGVTVNGASVVTADIEATNGVIHLIDEVLVPQVNIVEKAILTSGAQSLVAAVSAAGLASALQAPGPFTVFAPIDEAFEALGAYLLDALLAPDNVALLTEILTYHVIEGDIRAADLTDGAMVTTLEGRAVTIDLSGTTPKVNGVNIIATDIVVSNGVIHLIDGVLLPALDIVETAIVTDQTSTLVAAVVAGELVETLKGDGPYTVFAPINEAFSALGGSTLEALLDPANLAILQDVLTYHVIEGDIRAADLTDGAVVTTVEGTDVVIDLSGETPKVNGANIIATDIATENGVIHLIDAVLTESLDIVQRAIVTEQTSTLVAAVVAGELVETLKGDGPYTVFAPINEAFAALGTDKLDVLLDPANLTLLQKILTYHVIEGDIRAADLTDGAVVTTVEGTDVVIDLSGETPKVNGANIIATDIVTENGVIHLIDAVLTDNADLVDVAILKGFDTLVELVGEAGLAPTLRGDNSGAGFTVFAPTDAAFAALASVPAGDALASVLTYHVVSGTVLSGDLSNGQVVTTVQEGAFTVNIQETSVSITDGSGNTVNVVLVDVPAANGVIHVIDGVLLPSS